MLLTDAGGLNGSRLSAFGFRLSAFGFRLPAFGFRLSAFGSTLIADVVSPSTCHPERSEGPVQSPPWSTLPTSAWILRPKKRASG
jgi:hypothetical protein